MRKFAGVLLAVLLGCSVATEAFADLLQKGDVVYAMYGMRGRDKEIYWHNMRALPVLVPAGTRATVVASTYGDISFQVGAVEYHLTATAIQWGKYFAKNIKAVNLEKASLENIAEGMSKEDVYVIKGCPAYVGSNIKSDRKSLDQVLKRDVWYYSNTTARIDTVVVFSNGKVQSIQVHGHNKKV